METEVENGSNQESPKAQSNTVRRIGGCYEVTEVENKETFAIKTDEGFVVHYYIEMMENQSVVLELVGENGEPTGKLIEQIQMDDFSKRFKTCSQHKCPLQTKTVDEISKKMAENRIEMGEKHLENGEAEKAEDKFNRALKFDEKNVRATLGLGKAKLEQEKIEEAMEIFKKLSEENSIYDQDNKHTLNAFGIYLRKKGLHNLAIDSYEKAISLDPKDEALYFNLGRAYGIKGSSIEDAKECIEILQKAIGILQEALSIKTDFSEAKEYMNKLLGKEKVMLKNLLEASNPKNSD